MIQLNAPAPDFTVTTTLGTQLRLQELRGRYVVLFFFPKAFTPGCTREAAQFRDTYPELQALGAEVIGISTDDQKTQCDFAQSLSAQYPMVADPEGHLARAFDVFWGFIRMVRRVTFIIDPEGRVRAVLQHEIRIGKHIDEAVAALKRLQKLDAPEPVRRLA